MSVRSGIKVEEQTYMNPIDSVCKLTVGAQVFCCERDPKVFLVHLIHLSHHGTVIVVILVTVVVQSTANIADTLLSGFAASSSFRALVPERREANCASGLEGPEGREV